MKNALVITLLLFSTFATAQKTKKLTIKSEYPVYKETFYVLRSDVSIKHGTYEKKIHGKISKKGQFSNGEKFGVWEYYDANGQLAHKVDVTTNELLYNRFQDEVSKSNIDKYSRPGVILGGLSSFYQKIGQYLRYPAEARRKGTQGKVKVRIVVSDEGKIKDVKVIEGKGDGLDEEAVRVMKLVDFEALPALDLNGKPIESEMTFPVTFQLA